MLSQTEVSRFVEQGFVVIRAAIPPDVARDCRRSAAEHLDIDLGRPETWIQPVLRGVPTGECFREAAHAPALLEAVGQLVEPAAWDNRPNLGAFVVRFPSEDDPGDAGWHIDSSFQPPGDPRWFVNYRSKHRALLLLCLLSDVGPEDAPSRIAPGSHLEMARLLAPAGESGLPGAFAGQESLIPLPRQLPHQALATGSAGDVYVCHPFLVHAASWPHRGHEPRFLAQPPISMPDAFGLGGSLVHLPPVARAIRIGLEGPGPRR
jgi:Phytanoyl-CoA dioxygenase (PhyH)